jgi:hypothetical protein
MDCPRSSVHLETWWEHLLRLGTVLLFSWLLPHAAHCAEATQPMAKPPSGPSSITMATDKTNYAPAEIIKLKVSNSLHVPIWYIGYPQRDLRFWEIERAQSNGWQRLHFRLPVIEGGREVCRLRMYEQPIGQVTELKPHCDLLYEWNQKICPAMTPTKPSVPQMIERGRYRFALRYSMETVKTEDVKTKPWKRPIDLGGTKEVHSNEFVLE